MTEEEILNNNSHFKHSLELYAKAKGYEFISADVKLIPQTTTELTDETMLKNMNRLVDMLEDDDDVQNVYHNWEIAE